MDRLISEKAVLEAFREYQGSISDFYKAVKAMPSADIDTLIDGADAVGYRRGYKEAQLAIPSAEPYKEEPSGDVISRQAVLDQTYLWSKDEFLRVTNPFDYLRKRINSLPSVNPQEPKKCKDCKWWRDSDGAYRRGVKAESRCPINTVSVANGWGYCYMFEEQERSE